MNAAVLPEGAFAFLGLFCEYMTFKRLLVRDLTRAGYLEPFFSTRVGLDFWHYFIINFYTLLAFRTGGNLWSLVGNHFLLYSGK